MEAIFSSKVTAPWQKAILFGALLSTVLSLVACAPEQSLEERKREDAGRAYERLSKAAGNYFGYIVDSEREITPLSVAIQVVKNPTSNGEKPLLTVGLRVGLFDGVAVASTSTAFDWGAGEVVASFARNGSASTVPGSSSPGGPNGPGGPGGTGAGTGGIGTGSGMNGGGFELRGYIENDRLSRATLTGARLGKREIVLEKSGKNLFDADVPEVFEVRWSPVAATKPESTAPDLRAVLKLKRKPFTQPAPATSDLPYMPGLEASLEFAPFAATPQQAKVVYYDPLAATLDAQFSDVSSLHVTGLTLQKDSLAVAAPAGNLVLGGAALRQVRLEPTESAKPVTALPPTTYLGTYQGTPTAIAYTAIAYINFLGDAGMNTPDLPFLTFPKMRVELDKCDGGEVFEQTVLELRVLDYLKHKAVFHRLNTEHDPLEVTFDNDWTKLEGFFLQADPHSGGMQPRVALRANTAVAQAGCATPH